MKACLLEVGKIPGGTVPLFPGVEDEMMPTMLPVQLATASFLFAGMFRRIGRNPLPVVLLALAVLGLGVWLGYAIGSRKAAARNRSKL